MKIPLIFLLVLALLPSCALGPPRFEVAVNSIAASDVATPDTYILISGDENVKEVDLQFQEYAQYLHRALQARGFVLSETADKAKVAIVLSYGIGDPNTQQYSYSLPRWGQTGVSSSTTYGTISNYGGGMASYSGTTTYTPTYGVTGYSSHVRTRTTYFRHARITAYNFEEFRRSNVQTELWQTVIGSSGASGDLRRVFPILVAAAIPYLGTNSGRQIQVRLYERSNAVQAVMGEIPFTDEDS